MLEEYSLRVARAWKLGHSILNNGILMLEAMRDRALRIEVGLGLENVLTSAVCKEILDSEMIPFFKQGEYYQGIDNGIRAIARLLARKN